MDTPLHRLFSGFPGGLPGIALLLLRAVVAVTILMQGQFYLVELDPTAGTWLVGFMAMVTGALLVVGLLTPLVAAVGALGIAASGLSVLPSSTPTLFEGKLTMVLAATMLTAIVFLGPGAFSVDARVFGRREIIIPPMPPSQE